MKKLFFSLVVLFASTVFSQAQFVPFLAQDGLKIATDSATAINPKATLMGLMSLSSADPQFPMIFDIGTTTGGQATLWLYIFDAKTSTGGDSTLGFEVFAQSVGPTTVFLAMNISDQLSNTKIYAPLPKTWLNSDGMVKRLYTDANFTKFHAANPDSMPNIIILVKDSASPFGNGVATWELIFQLGVTPILECFVNAESVLHEVKCVSLGLDGVSENALNLDIPMKAYPNPASSSVILQIHPSVIRDNGRLFLYNSLGERITKFPSSPINTDQTELYIGLSNYPNGAYFLRYESSAGVFTTPLVIEK